MSTASDEGGGGPQEPTGRGARWVLEDPDGVAFQLPGSEGPLWRAPRVTVTRIFGDDEKLVWDRIDIDTLLLSQTSGLFLLQGLPVGQLFPPDGYFSHEALERMGPLLFLAGRAVLSDPPPRLLGVRLGHIIQFAEGTSRSEILGKLVESVLQDPTMLR